MKLLYYLLFVLGHFEVLLELYVFPYDILLANPFEPVVRSFEEVGKNIFHRFVMARILFDAYVAQFGLAESHVQFVLGKEFLQCHIQAARFHRERDQWVERL